MSQAQDNEQTQARRAFAADLRGIAEGIEAGDFDLCVVAFRLSHIEGQPVDQPQTISGRFAAPGSTYEDLRGLATKLVEHVQDEQEGAQAKRRAPESKRR